MQTGSSKRFLEILPGTFTWLSLAAPFVLIFSWPTALIILIIFFDLYWLFRSVRLSINTIRVYFRMRRDLRKDWYHLAGKNVPTVDGAGQPLNAQYLKFDDLYQAVIMVHYKESYDLLEHSIDSYVDSQYPLKEKMIFVLASEERNKTASQQIFAKLKQKFAGKFLEFVQTIHPANLPGEIKCKSANTTWGAKRLKKIIDSRGIGYDRVLVNNFDADTRVHPQYFAYLAYKYLTTPLGQPTSFQPIHVYSNNIWDTPAMMRIVAQSCTLIFMHNILRPARFHCFSSRSDSFKIIDEIGFWVVDAIPEDSRQYYDCYFKYGGAYTVEPLYIPLRMDAVLAEGYWRTVQNQYRQLRRWAWGISDFAYVVQKAAADKSISWWRKLGQILRLWEGHWSWAVASIYIAFLGWLPVIFNRGFANTVLGYNFPIATRIILGLALVGLIVTVILSFLLLPPRPQRYHPIHYLQFVYQWILIPIVSIFLSSLAAIDAQTRLMFGKYLEYQVTEKAIKK